MGTQSGFPVSGDQKQSSSSDAGGHLQKTRMRLRFKRPVCGYLRPVSQEGRDNSETFACHCLNDTSYWNAQKICISID